MIWHNLLLAVGIATGFWLGFRQRPPALTPTVEQLCAVSETGAERCDHALLTCLSVQVRFIHEMEDLQNVCSKR